MNSLGGLSVIIHGNPTTQSLSELVSSPDCTLEDVLDHPDLQKEVRLGEMDPELPVTISSYSMPICNDSMTSAPEASPLVEWMSRPKVLGQMVSYLTKETSAMAVIVQTVKKPKVPTKLTIIDNDNNDDYMVIDSNLHKAASNASIVGDELDRQSIFEQIPQVTLTDFAPLSRDGLCVNLREHYYDENFEGENSWCRLTLDPPQETCSQVSQKAVYKYPFIIHEILTECSKRLLVALGDNEEVLMQLFSFFSVRRPLNPVLLGYTSSLVSTLMAKCNLSEFFEKHEDTILDDLLFHLESRSVAEILKMLLFEERGKLKDPEAIILRLFDCMDLSLWPCDVLVGERQENVFLIVRELIHSEKSCPLHNQYMYTILSSQIPDQLMEAVFHWHKSTVTSSIGILVEIMMYLDPATDEEEMIQERYPGEYGTVMTDFDADPKFADQEDLEIPMEHQYRVSSDDEAPLTASDILRLSLEPPLYPLEPLANDLMSHSNSIMAANDLELYLDRYTAIWVQYDRLFLTDDSEAAIEGYQSTNNGMVNEANSYSMAQGAPVEQYAAPPRPYRSSGEFFDLRLRKYLGRLLVELLEPLASAAASHRDRRRNKTNRSASRNGRRAKGKHADDDEDDDADECLDISPNSIDVRPGFVSSIEPAVESCEPLRDDLMLALYPDPNDPTHPCVDPYFTLEWYYNSDILPPCDPKHNALQHLIDVIPPEYTFSEYQSGRKVMFGLVQNAFQNGVRPIVGHRLLEILHLFRAFIRVQGSQTFHLYIVKILKCVHTLLFAHKWNSILHISLGDIIIYAMQRGPAIWPEAVEHFIGDSGFFHLAARFMRRYVRYKKETVPETRRDKRQKLHSGTLPIVLEILRIFHELARGSEHILRLLQRVCVDWDTFSPLLEDRNVENIDDNSDDLQHS
eukprot:GHVH01006066.1.p1 GENE.GHVH01006066.1~~GHVH01006066.1.p1  ORF type:complete len:912 (+),score=125.43 GHVH01006066.1:238-2973(+)